MEMLAVETIHKRLQWVEVYVISTLNISSTYAFYPSLHHNTYFSSTGISNQLEAFNKFDGINCYVQFLWL
jgi:hypothetical protein